MNDDDNGQEAAPDEQTIGVKRRRLTDAEILENENVMPEKRGSGVCVRTYWRVCTEEYKLWSE